MIIPDQTDIPCELCGRSDLPCMKIKVKLMSNRNPTIVMYSDVSKYTIEEDVDFILCRDCLQNKDERTIH